uniref:Uncharacterized protein n=1 Tax=Timema shepardi TaxID=629360 RepID=A0A7R9AQS9_TIMSH|nr:unnamed protein product [Timema shepardi]
MGIGKVELEKVNPILHGGRVESHLEKSSPVHPTEIRTLISPSSAVELNTTSALDNYATKAVPASVALLANALVVLSPTAEDEEIKVQISVGCPRINSLSTLPHDCIATLKLQAVPMKRGQQEEGGESVGE